MGITFGLNLNAYLQGLQTQIRLLSTQQILQVIQYI